ncbi:MAG: hypothetical protein ACNS64_07435 [Candidatus Halalkalibacterium sp. M3_1C_030]
MVQVPGIDLSGTLITKSDKNTSTLMENAENLNVLKSELKAICEQLTKQMDQIDNTVVQKDSQDAKVAC